jgi:hypothetical protein
MGEYMFSRPAMLRQPASGLELPGLGPLLAEDVEPVATVVQNSLQGIQPGRGQSGIYGSPGNTTYDPRQVQAVLKIRF